MDSRKRVAGSDSDFEVDLGESLHLQSDARLAVYKIRLADSFLSTDRGRYLYWVDAALGTLNWALLPEGAYTGTRLAAWVSSNFAIATYSETTNSLSVAYDGNRLILNDLELLLLRNFVRRPFHAPALGPRVAQLGYLAVQGLRQPAHVVQVPLPLLRLPALPKPIVEGPRLLQFSVALQQQRLQVIAGVRLVEPPEHPRLVARLD